MTPYRNRAQGNYSKKENNGREKMKAHTLHAGKPSSVPALSFWLQVSKPQPGERGRRRLVAQESSILEVWSKGAFLLGLIRRTWCVTNNVIGNFLAAFMFLTALKY